MIELRTAISMYLKSIHPRAYHSDSVPENAEFPYLVYDLPDDSDDGESMELVVVDIDGWDSPPNGDTTSLELLMASVNRLNKQVLTTQGLLLPWQPSNTGITAVLYLDRKLSLKDDDPRIKRRKHIYQAKLFRRG